MGNSVTNPMSNPISSSVQNGDDHHWNLMKTMKSDIESLRADMDALKGLTGHNSSNSTNRKHQRSLSMGNVLHIKHEELVREILDLRQRFEEREVTPRTPREEILSALREEIQTLRAEYEALNEHQLATDQKMVDEVAAL